MSIKVLAKDGYPVVIKKKLPGQFPKKMTVDEKSFEGQPKAFKSFAVEHWEKYEIFEY
jgi:hypothetical protein